MLRKTLSSITVLLLCTIPLLPTPAHAASNDAAQAVIDAKKDADAMLSITGQKWVVFGSIGGMFGIFLAHIAEPSIPANKLVDKSLAYVSAYTTTYQAEVKRENVIDATQGCAVVTAPSTLIGIPYSSFVSLGCVVLTAISAHTVFFFANPKNYLRKQ